MSTCKNKPQILHEHAKLQFDVPKGLRLFAAKPPIISSSDCTEVLNPPRTECSFDDLSVWRLNLQKAIESARSRLLRRNHGSLLLILKLFSFVGVLKKYLLLWLCQPV